jgi:hypothetical protein
VEEIPPTLRHVCTGDEAEWSAAFQKRWILAIFNDDPNTGHANMMLIFDRAIERAAVKRERNKSLLRRVLDLLFVECRSPLSARIAGQVDQIKHRAVDAGPIESVSPISAFRSSAFRRTYRETSTGERAGSSPSLAAKLQDYEPRTSTGPTAQSLSFPVSCSSHPTRKTE